MTLESRRAHLRTPADPCEDATVTIRYRSGLEIMGVILDASPAGMGIAIASYQPIDVDDLVTIESRLGTHEAIVRHRTDRSVVHIGLEYISSVASR